jgi:putative acetyltransferase
MMKLIRTDSDNIDFQTLVAKLDRELRARDGNDHAFFAQFNKIDSIRHAIVAYLNEKAVGCGAFKPFEESAVEIKRMFVLPEIRGQRIAEKILDELERWANELDYTHCVLETGQKQPEAIRLYERSGYTVIPNYGQYIGVENSVCMKKTIR